MIDKTLAERAASAMGSEWEHYPDGSWLLHDGGKKGRHRKRWDPEHDANDDLEVRNWFLKTHATGVMYRRFVDATYDLWNERWKHGPLLVASMSQYWAFCWYEPGDYTRAILAALEEKS